MSFCASRRGIGKLGGMNKKLDRVIIRNLLFLSSDSLENKIWLSVHGGNNTCMIVFVFGIYVFRIRLITSKTEEM